ncbi:MAG: L,D-transpeptidase family protein, partial [Candidatus Hydrogenedentes bacterium]|nr:L,D-transpeptidase family protein [Candidatus Hydrogenedentota bacterium]
IAAAYVERLLDGDTGLFVDSPGSAHGSLHANALPLAFGLVPPESVERVVELIREKRLNCGVYIAPFVIEACYRAGQPDLAYDLIVSTDEHSWHEMLKHGATTCMEAWGPEQKWNTSWCHAWSSGPIYLIAEYVMGLTPAEPGWTAVRFAPRPPQALAWADIALSLPTGRIRARYDAVQGYTLATPDDVPVHIVDVPDGTGVAINGAVVQPPANLDAATWRYLDDVGWRDWVGGGLGVWVSVDEQVLRVIEGRAVQWQARCSTAANGTGSQAESGKTPLGWHSVAEKVGAGAPWGEVFRSRRATGQRWTPGMEVDEDMVLTRILVLDGEEPGKNRGAAVDSRARCIYVHGTNGEDRIGTPASHGCIRLRNDDVILAFGLIDKGARLLITERREPAPVE